MTKEEFVYQDFETLENFMKDVFVGIGVPEKDAKTCAEVLIESDKRGIDSQIGQVRHRTRRGRAHRYLTA